jgi:hypothetical protein
MVGTIEQQEVFRRALWRQPSQEDAIHNAERRKWADAGGVTRWEWFLSITPGPTLEAGMDTNHFPSAKSISSAKKTRRLEKIRRNGFFARWKAWTCLKARTAICGWLTARI